MTKRLGMFLGLGFCGVLLLLTGLAWDAVAHAHDPSLAGREGIFTLRNPGHALMGLGIGLVLVSLIGACETLLTSAASGRWARPGVRQAFLTASTAVVVTAAAVTSWAAGSAGPHTGVAAGGHGGAPGGQLASAPGGGPHGDPGAAGGTAGVGGHGAVAGAADALAGNGVAPAGHDHSSGSDATSAGPDGPGPPDHDAPSGTAAVGADHGHLSSGPGAVSAAAGHDHAATAAGGRGPSAGHDHGAAGFDPDAADRGADGNGAGAGPAQPPAPGAPQGTWADLRYGPFVIPPAGAGGDAQHADIAVPSLARPCTDCFLLELRPDLVYADGRPANLDTGMMLHHAVLFAAGRPDATCGPDQPFPGKLGQRFFASGNERTPGLFPPGFGYYAGGGNWTGIFHVMNHGTEAKTVFFRLRVRWSPAAAGGVLPLTPIWLDMNNCRTSEYAVPAGPSSSHWTWTSTLTGRIVSTGGHVHNGGIRTTLSNQTTGQHLCTSWAGWGKNPAYEGSIESMSVCSWDRVGTVRKGQVLDLESVYDAPRPVPDAMGIMMAFVYETTDLAAGTDAPPSVRGEGPPPVESTPPPSSSHDHH